MRSLVVQGEEFVKWDENALTYRTAELSAHFTVWLASSEAAFLAGKFVWVNWDAQELLSRRSEIENSMLLRVLLEGMPQ